MTIDMSLNNMIVKLQKFEMEFKEFESRFKSAKIRQNPV